MENLEHKIWDGSNYEEIHSWIRKHSNYLVIKNVDFEPGVLGLRTMDSHATAKIGDKIVKYNNDFYVIKNRE